MEQDALLQKILELKTKHRQDLFRKEGVNGLAVGYKYVKGKRTAEVCLQVFVKKKLPLESLSLEERIPNFIEDVVTDVTEAEFEADIDRKAKHRPAPGGVSIINHRMFGSGTLGFVWGDSKLIFSNNHILANMNDCSLGDAIVQQSLGDGGVSYTDRIARLYDWEPLHFYPAPNGAPANINIMDAAVAYPLSPDDVSYEIAEVGTPVGFTTFTLGQTVTKSGRTTGVQTGEVVSIDWEGWVGYSVGYGYFTGQYRVQAVGFTAGGDSGSAVVRTINGSIYIGGLHFAGSSSGEFSIESPIQAIMARFPTDVPPPQITEHSTSLSPNRDTYLAQASPNTNYGAGGTIYVRSSVGNIRRGIFYFPPIWGEVIPDNATLTLAQLKLYYFGKFFEPDGRTYWVHDLEKRGIWVELEATWNDYKAGAPWASPGGDYFDSSSLKTSVIMPSSYQWVSWDVGLILLRNKTWGLRSNLLLKDGDEGGTDLVTAAFYSRDFVTASLRPRLYFEYEIVEAVAPTVTTQAVTNVEVPTALGHGTIYLTGGENCDRRGICWNTSGNPTVADNKSEQAGSFGPGAFSRLITGLIAGETYYVKAYARNSAGYGYGSQVQFTTPAAGQNTTIASPVVSLDSVGKVPSMNLGVSLLPYTVPIAYTVLPIPTLTLDRIFDAPTLNVDSQAPSPDWSQEALLSPPAITIDSEAEVPSFILDVIPASPLVAIDSTAPTPGIFDRVFVIIEVPVVKIDSGAVEIFPSIVTIDSEALLAWLGDAEIRPPAISLNIGVFNPGLSGISITILPPVVSIEGGAILFLPPAATIDSAVLTPTQELGVTLSSPSISIESGSIIPTLALDKILGVPLIPIDSEALTAAFILEAIVSSPLVTVNGEALIVTLRLDKILDIPLTQLDIEAPIPFFRRVQFITVVAPLATIEEEGLIPALYMEFFRGIKSFEGRSMGGFVGRELKDFEGRRIG